MNVSILATAGTPYHGEVVAVDAQQITVEARSYGPRGHKALGRYVVPARAVRAITAEPHR